MEIAKVGRLVANVTANLSELAEVARKHWHTPYALVLAEILLSLVLAVLLGVVKLGAGVGVAAFGLLWVITFIVWWHTNRLPKTKKDKVGFVISLSTGDETEHKKVMEDLVLTLHELLKAGTSGRLFQLIRAPQHIAERIVDFDGAHELLARCRAHFIVYGRVRLRAVGGRQEHVINLEGVVAHRPLPNAVRGQLSQEFAELLPRSLRLATENDVFSFAFTSGWINCVSKYIIGIAAFCSGAIDYAEELQSDVNRLLDGQDKNFPIFGKLKQRVPRRLTEIHLARARAAFRRWSKSRDAQDIAEAGRHLAKVPAVCANHYDVLIMRSVLLFLERRDAKAAIGLLKKCKKAADGTWLYNLGFLHAYMGNLSAALGCYKKATALPLEPPVLGEVEDFICWTLDEEPSRYQLHFCLGYINWKAKGDEVRALEDFRTFLSLGDGEEYARERALVRAWISSIAGAQPPGGVEIAS
jgi:tetratricopeptide (TPR) repeat protein